MKISDLEIQSRMDLLAFDRESIERLASYKSLIEESIDDIVDEFYEKQTAIDEISLLIGDADTLYRLRNAQRKYVIDLFSGNFDAEYVNNRLRIGMVHKRIGVEPKLYLSAVNILKELIILVLKDNIQDELELQKTLSALSKVMYFDITLVFDTYIDCLVGEIENAKRKTEDYAFSLEQKVAERTKQLEEQAKLDPLTELYNQRALQHVLNRDLASARRRSTKLSLVYFDVDDFKQINDQFGHLKGDEVLKYVGQSLFANIREVDTPCRYGGDEFCLVLPECSLDNAKGICEKIIEYFSKQYPDFYLSFGIAQTGPDNFVEGQELIKMADENMYKAKSKKGFQIVS